MRFFSNDKDARDDQQGVDVQDRADEVNPDQAHDDHPERVQSDPVAVPEQRTGSPWSSTPDTDSRDDSEAELSDQERQDGTVDTATDDAATDDAAVTNGHDDDTNRPPFHDSDTDFSRTDSHGDDALRPDDSEERHDGDDLVPSDASTTATSEAGTGSHRADLDQPVDLELDDKGSEEDSETVREDTTPPDHAVSDTAADATVDGGATTTTYGPDGTVTTTDSSDTDSSDTSSSDETTAEDSADEEPAAEESALKDEGDFSDPQAVDPVTDEPLASDDSATDDTASATDDSDADSGSDDSVDGAEVAPVVAAVPVAAAAATAAGSAAPATDSKPGSVTAPDLGTLFGADDAQSFHDRWRDVQLRFVDSPKEATAEAAHLVDEAVDKLTASLKSQKEALSGDNGEDTEKLRVELRGYRDILNRILDL